MYSNIRLLSKSFKSGARYCRAGTPQPLMRSGQPLSAARSGSTAHQFTSSSLCNSKQMGARTIHSPSNIPRRALSTAGGEALLPRSADALASTLCGLQDSSSDDPPVLEFLDIATEQIRECKEPFNPEHVYASLVGMQGMRSESIDDSNKVLRLLDALADKIEACEGPWSLGELSSSIFGLQNMSSDYAEVRRLVGILGAKLAASSGEGTATGFSDLLFGLQGMSTDHEEVTKLLDVIALKLKACNDEFKLDDIAFFVHGMQRMSSSCPAVRALLADQVARLKALSEEELIDFETASAFILGMQDMSSDAVEVRDLMRAVAHRFALIEAVPVAELAASLSCMRGMKSKHAETCELLSRLLDVLEESREPFSADDVILCLRSLQSMESSEPVVRRYLTLLKERIFNCQEPLDASQLNAVMKACLAGLDTRHPEAMNLMSLLYYKLQQAVGPGHRNS